MTLFGKRVFVDTIMNFKVRLSWVIWVDLTLNPMADVFIRTGKHTDKKRRNREEGSLKMEAETEGTIYEPGTAKDCQHRSSEAGTEGTEQHSEGTNLLIP